jgi:aminomethyltransferase
MANLRTPLYDWHRARGARMVPFGGWDMPVQYTGVIAEHQAVRTSAGLFDISHMGRLAFTGPAALALLERVVTNSVATLKDGQVRYALVCNEAGGILDDVLVYRWSAGYSLVVNASNREKIVAWLERHRTGLDVKVYDQTLNSGMLAVQGPKAVELCAGLFDTAPDGLRYYFGTPTRWKGNACLVSRTGYTGEDGVEVSLDKEHVAELADEFVSRGAVPAGLGARDTLRLEAAMPLYGHELSETTDPFQAGLGWAVKLDKGDFLGRDALLKLKSDTGRPVRVGLALDGKRAAREGSPVLAGGAAAGTVTSGSFTPTLGKSVAMAYLAPAHAAPGTAVEIDIRGSREPARVVPLPFYKRPARSGERGALAP